MLMCLFYMHLITSQGLLIEEVAQVWFVMFLRCVNWKIFLIINWNYLLINLSYPCCIKCRHGLLANGSHQENKIGHLQEHIFINSWSLQSCPLEEIALMVSLQLWNYLMMSRGLDAVRWALILLHGLFFFFLGVIIQ